MNYIILDLEFNQHYEFNEGESYTLEEDCPFEIIQIGAVKLDKNFNMIDTFNHLIKPNIYKRMHPFVEKLTGITEEILENQKSFKTIYKLFTKFFNYKEDILCVWGSYDIKALYKNAQFYNLDTSKLPTKFINIQSTASAYLNNSLAIGLQKAIEALKINIDSSFHDALNDAKYTAKIFIKLKEQKFNVFEIYNSNEKLKIRDLSSQKNIKEEKTDLSMLYKYVEKKLGRKILQHEKKIYREVYFLGRSKKFG